MAEPGWEKKLDSGAQVVAVSGQIEFAKWPTTTPDGRTQDRCAVWIMPGPYAVALDEKTRKVFVVVQERLGKVTSVEFPGVALQPGEAPIDGARRALKREVGVEAVDETADWIPLSGPEGVTPVNAFLVCPQYPFLVLRVRQTTQPPPSEIARVQLMTFMELEELDLNQGIADPLNWVFYKARAWLQRNRPDLLA
jgi:hypothetical protein